MIGIFSLKPFLQDTHSQRLVLDAIKAYKAVDEPLSPKVNQIKAQAKFFGALLVGVIESISYLVLSIFSKFCTIFIHSARKQVHLNFHLAKGAGCSAFISLIGLWKTQQACELPRSIEKAVDEECQKILRDSHLRLQKTVQSTQLLFYSQDVEKQRMSSAEWEKQSTCLEIKITNIYKRLKKEYPSTHVNHKYTVLIENNLQIEELVAEVDALIRRQFK